MAVKVQSAALQVFGAEVRRYREDKEISQASPADRFPVPGSYIGAVERGETRCTRAFAVSLDDILDARGALPSLWDKLVRNPAFPTWFDWPSVEEGADSLQSYQCLVVQGLLQTPDYALCLLKGDKEAAEARIGRQAVLTRDDPPPPRLTIVLYEGVLHHQVGTRETCATSCCISSSASPRRCRSRSSRGRSRRRGPSGPSCWRRWRTAARSRTWTPRPAALLFTR